MKSVFKLTDADIDACLDGAANATLVWEVLRDSGVVVNGVVNPNQFAIGFARVMEEYIDADSEAEFTEGNRNNLEWGFAIADNINDLIRE